MAGTKLQPEGDLIPNQRPIDPIDGTPLDRATLRDIDVQETAARPDVREAREDAIEARKDAIEAGEKARDEAIEKEAKAIAKNTPEPARAGDILGLSDASPAVEIPQATTDHSGNPAGIEVRSPTSGTSELRQTGGATGVQLGAGETSGDRDR